MQGQARVGLCAVASSAGGYGLEPSDDVAALRAELERVRHEHALAEAEARHGQELAQAREAHS